MLEWLFFYATCEMALQWRASTATSPALTMVYFALPAQPSKVENGEGEGGEGGEGEGDEGRGTDRVIGL